MTPAEFWRQGAMVACLAVIVWCAMAYGHADAAELFRVNVPDDIGDFVAAATGGLFVGGMFIGLYGLLLMPARRAEQMGGR